MEKWKQVLQNSGLKLEKLRKKVKQDIDDYNDAFDYLINAKQKLSASTDDNERAEIANDIKEIEADLADLDNEIVNGIQHDIATMEKRREVAKKAFNGGGRQSKQPAAPKASTDPEPEPETQPTPAQAAAGGVVGTGGDGDGKDKKSGNIWEWVIGGAVAAGCVYLGISYQNSWFPFNRKR